MLAASLAASLFSAARGWQVWTEADNSPGPRDGHSLHVYNGSVVLFGGRSNEIVVEHNPKTFSTARVNGSLVFTSYDAVPVVTCGPLSPPDCLNITVTRLYNDLWTYPLQCQRSWDTGCIDAAWSQLETGAPLGGCNLVNNVEVCTHPQERFGHISAMFSDGTLAVYGGYSKLCEDYCSDVWALNVAGCMATRSAPAPMTGSPGLDSALGGVCTWQLLESLNWTSPGKRWRQAAAQAGDAWYFFGGHRLWQGFGSTNSLANLWLNQDQFPYGGMFDDLWVMSYNGNTSSLVSTAGGGTGGWQQVLPRESCYSSTANNYAARNDIYCTVIWPSARAHAAMAAVPGNGTNSTLLYLFGGYTVSFPHPQAFGRGAGPGVGALAGDGPKSYPSLPSFLSDLWLFDTGAGLWTQLQATASDGSAPAGRRGHSLTLAGGVLFLFGGRSYSDLLGDTWLYNLVSGMWVPKTTHVHALYPPACTSDVTELAVPAGVVIAPGAVPQSQASLTLAFEGTPLVNWTDLLPLDARAVGTLGGGDGLTGVTQWDATTLMYGAGNVSVPLVNNMSVVVEATRGTLLDATDGRWSDPVFVPQYRRQAPGWDGCRDRIDGRTDLPAALQWLTPSQRMGHAVTYSDAAGLLLLYGGEAVLQESLPSINVTVPTADVADLWTYSIQHCANNCSGHGGCDHGFCVCVAGWYGVDCSNATCPGDFCLYDPGSFSTTCVHCAALPHMHYLRMLLQDPAVNQASAYRLVFLGQMAAAGTLDPTIFDPAGDYFQHTARKGPLNISSLSLSAARTRYLFDGSFDMSTDSEGRRPVSLAAALAAAARLSRGQCNGFGQCVCAPPFLGDDCSVKDCANNCFGRGLCVVEYPAARCDCDPPYGGVDCSIVVCPNNCNGANGVCQPDGTCACAWMLNPYNNLVNFTQFAGADCSFVQPFAGASAARPSPLALLLLFGVVTAALAAGGGHRVGNAGVCGRL